MSLKIQNSFTFTVHDFADGFQTQNRTVQTADKSSKPQLPPVDNVVGFTALGCDTEEKLARASLMAAAAKAGISDVAAQNKFADKMLAAEGINLFLDKKIELNDQKVKSTLLNQNIKYTLTDSEKTVLTAFRKDYVANGGKIRFNSKPTIDLRQANSADGVNNSTITLPNTKFRVVLNNDGRPVNAERILSQYAENTYKGGNLWGDNYRKIGEMSADQGIKPKITGITDVGNKKFVEFQLTPFDRSVVNENYKIVQNQANEIEKLVEKINRENPVSQFILGAVNGIKDNLVGTATMIAHPLETLTAIKDAVVALSNLTADDVTKIAGLLKDKVKTTFTTKDGINSIPYGAGYAVGMIATDVVIGKGAGITLEGLKEIKPIASLLTKLEELKTLSKAKIVEAFSDEAAQTAANRLRQRLAATTLYAGIPADALADLAVVATNKVKNGAVKFSEFSRQMIKDLGENIRPKLLDLYQAAFEKVYGARKTLELNELLGGHSIDKHIGKSEGLLRQRLINEPFTDIASSFRNYETANRTVGKAIRENSAKIEEWLKNTIETRIKLTVKMDEEIGIVLERGKGRSVGLKTAKPTNEAELILIKDDTPQGWHVLTSYPSN